MNKTELESLTWLYFDGEISETELVRLRRGIASSAESRAIYAKLHRIHLATVVAVCGSTVDLRQVPPNLLTLVDSEPALGPDARKIVGFAASFGAIAACAALAFVTFSQKPAEPGASPALATVTPATTPAAPVVATVSPTPAPAEVVGRYAPTSPSAKALSESTRNLGNIAGDTFSIGNLNQRQSPAFGSRNQDAPGFDMTQVGNDSETGPAVSPAILTEDYFNTEEELIGAPQKSSNLPNQPLIIR